MGWPHASFIRFVHSLRLCLINQHSYSTNGFTTRCGRRACVVSCRCGVHRRDGRDDEDREVAPGIYLVRGSAPEDTRAAWVVIIR
jgi:hypothetical protein